jgi:hypothetical protein
MTRKEKALERVRYARELLRNVAAARAAAARHELGTAEAAVEEVHARAEARADGLATAVAQAANVLLLESFARERELTRWTALDMERQRAEAERAAEAGRAALAERERELRVVERTIEVCRGERARAEHKLEQHESDDRAGSRRARSA